MGGGGIKKVFMILIAAVASVIIGALVLNVFLPNAVSIAVDSVENMIFQASGLSVDLDVDGRPGQAGTTIEGDTPATEEDPHTVDGFE